MLKEKLVRKFDELVEGMDLSKIGTLTNLKLYNISMDESYDSDLFYEFCQEQYDGFVEELEVKMKHVGNTSWFRIDFENGLYGNVYSYDDYDEKSDKKKMLIEEFLYSLNVDEDNLDEEYDGYERILFKELNDFVEGLKTIVETYTYIETYKTNQLQHWSEFLMDQEIV